jgi:CHAT domain-containing protein
VLLPGLARHPQVFKSCWKPIALIGLTLTALSLNGSTRTSAANNSINRSVAREIGADNAAGKHEYAHGSYLEAQASFLKAAALADRAGDLRSAALNWNNAGGSALAQMQYRTALGDFLKARQAAQLSGQLIPLAMTMNNLASLYLVMGEPSSALHIASEALAGPAANADATIRSKLRYQIADALSDLHRFDEADGLYRVAVDELEEQGDLDSCARILAFWGAAALKANRLDDAEAALSKALRLVRVHNLQAAALVLSGLAKVKARQGDSHAAESLFDAALVVPQNLTAKWALYANRGQFRLRQGSLKGALTDFREAHRLGAIARADIVPSDRDRVGLENDMSRLGAGLVDAGNRLAQQTGNRKLLEETFDTAEQDRLWSLRALLPASNDWRSRLPDKYWDLLARYQSTERILIASPSAALQSQATGLQLELQEEEAGADAGPRAEKTGSALAHVRSLLDSDSVLFSFYMGRSAGWLWAVDRTGVAVFPMSSAGDLALRVKAFAAAARAGEARAATLGAGLYEELFGAVPAAYKAHKRWLLELDGPLFDLPFAALVVNGGDARPVYLIERAALQAIPAALILDRRKAAGNGGFLGIGDAVYNAADSRYQGTKTRREDLVLPRLPSTGAELQACSRAWGGTEGGSGVRILTGREADLTSVRAALDAHPAVIHFATHVVTAPADHASGLIALSLDRAGAMGLMGPTEIVAHPVSADLVVLNGCHSGQGDALPGAGLMGLTRAWIGAGARSVLATSWDIPDEAGKNLMVEFYRAARARPDRGPAFALQQAQMAAIDRNKKDSVAVWAAYFLLGRE